MIEDRRQSTVWQNLLLIRHGESTANEINRFAGEIDAPLTKLGRAQAKVAGKGWVHGRVDRVYVSPLQRARETADILFDSQHERATRPPSVKLDERLSERVFGEFTLRNKTSLQRRFGLLGYEAALYSDTGDVQGAEPFEDFRRRILDFIKEEVYPALRKGIRVLIVAHKYVIELLSRLVLRLPEASGYDLRLPNARVISGDQLGRYVHRESRTVNRLNDYIVVNHGVMLSVAAFAGLLVNAFGVMPSPPRWLLLMLLGVAATISLARISLRNPPGRTAQAPISPVRILGRFMLLPWVATAVMMVSWPITEFYGIDYVLAIGLLLAAPTAVTAVVLSRTSGGMILPAALTVLLSTLLSLANTIALLAFFDQADLTLQASMFVIVSSGSLLLPLLIAQMAREYYPVSVAKAAEDHGAWAVLALAVFVILSFQQIPLESFYPSGLLALLLGILLRYAALWLSRQGSLYGVDDYFSMSYPNIFLLIVLASLMGNETLLHLATWFLVPMFVLSPLDDVLIHRMVQSQRHFGLFSYLRVNPSHPEATLGERVLPIRQTGRETA